MANFLLGALKSAATQDLSADLGGANVDGAVFGGQGAQPQPDFMSALFGQKKKQPQFGLDLTPMNFSYSDFTKQ